MKKLMFAAALAVVGSAFAVESANIVGYNTRELTNDKYVLGLPYVNTSSQALKIADVELKDGDDYAEAGEISWYDMTKGGFRFLNWSLEVYADPEDEDPIPGAKGWVNEDMGFPADYEEIVFTPGKWFFVAPQGCTDPSVTASGQLLTTDKTKPTTSIGLTNDKYCAGNPLPLETYLKDVVLMDGEDYAEAGEISWYDMTKGGFRFLNWSLEVYADPEDEDPIPGAKGWVNEDVGFPADYNSIKYDVGAGFFIAPQGCTDPSIAFENPFYED